MAIEIRQLVIRAVVDDGGRSSGSTPATNFQPRGGVGRASPALPTSVTTPQTAVELGADERQAIVNACVREVLRKLERARER